jgi:4-hydroxybenzoate polyprenyltransferase
MLSTVRTYASFVKFSHTVFALPFAIAGMAVAYSLPTYFLHPNIPADLRTNDEVIWGHTQFSWITVALIVCCMVGARSFAMAVNRILDRRIDALNPRTALREIPSGKVSVRAAWAFAIAFSLLYFGSCFALGDVVFALSPIPILLMTVYPFTKRFTALCHFVLGISLGLAPIGAWIAVRAMFPEIEYMGRSENNGQLMDTYLHRAGWRGNLFGDQVVLEGSGWEALGYVTPWLLGGAVALWVAGFDVIYALQDADFDRTNRLHSVPALLGKRGALWAARLTHGVSALLFLGFTYHVTHYVMDQGRLMGVRTFHLPLWVWAAPCVMLVGMIYQHSLVKPNDLSRVNVAFFTVNGIISVIFGAIFVAAWLLA